MKFNVKTTSLQAEKLDALFLGIFEGEKTLSSNAATLDKALDGSITDVLSGSEFTGKAGSHLLLLTGGKIGARRVVLLGMGKRAEFQQEQLRQAAGRAAQISRDYQFKSIGAPMMDRTGENFSFSQQGQAIAEGVLLGLYSFDSYRTGQEDKPRPVLGQVTLIAPAAAVADLKRGLADGEKIATAVKLTRDLVSTPARDLNPTDLANHAKEMADKHGIKCQIFDERGIEKLKMGALLGVARGSLDAQPPRFIVLEYLPVKHRKPLVFVGKGITFDSGGISIKPAEGMDKMKYDMAGGAAVIGALQAIASLELPVNVVGLIPATENMPGGHATHPGDILTGMSGKTIEIVNTDAEGRVILSDALTYAERYEPEAVVDLATLTGACSIALGHHAIALLGNDQGLIDQLQSAGQRSWERAWQLPLWPEYSEDNKSELADMKNSGGRAGGTITAAAMLGNFTGSYHWAHLDIASTAWTDKPRAYCPKGATGIGVRLLVEFAKEHAGSGKAAKVTETVTSPSSQAKAATNGAASSSPAPARTPTKRK